MPTGDGSSFGEALINAIAAAADGTVGMRRSYRAKGWHAQISKLTSSPRGYQAAARVGLSANDRTLRDWLAERREPNKANQGLIDKAYRAMAGRWPSEIEGRKFRISGEVTLGDDTRDRGNGIHAPLEIDGSQAGPAGWDRMRRAWEAGDVDEEDFEEWFIEDVLEADLGEMSTRPEFNGPAYTVEIA